MRTSLIPMAFLMGCTAFEPVLLDFEQVLPELSEVAAVLPTDRGFVVAGLVPEGVPQKTELAVLTLDDTGRLLESQVYAGVPNSQDRVNGIVRLPDGGWLVHGHDGQSVTGSRFDARGQRIWEGRLGDGLVGRSAALDVSGQRVALVGSGYRETGFVFWVTVLELQGEAVVPLRANYWTGSEAGRTAQGLAITARSDGGFLVGGQVSGEVDEHPVLLRLEADGTLEPTNLYPGAMEKHGRVTGLLALSDGRYAMASVEHDQGAFGLLDLDDLDAWRPRHFCAGDLSTTRPISLAVADGQVRIAGWYGWSERVLWLYASDLEGESATLRTFGLRTTGAGSDRLAVRFTPAGGVALAATICDADIEACEHEETERPVPMLWHMDREGSGFGTLISGECP